MTSAVNPTQPCAYQWIVDRPSSAGSAVTDRTPNNFVDLAQALLQCVVTLLAQQLQAAATPAAGQGVCANCGGACLPLAVYCDSDCRSDHECCEGVPR